MFVSSPVHFILYLLKGEYRAFCTGIIVYAGCVDF